MANKKIIYLDFDGTVVEHAYPAIGPANPHALQIIKNLQANGHQIILNTMRSEFRDASLQAALNYINKNEGIRGIEILKTTPGKIIPPNWKRENLVNKTEIFIDDIAEGIPLINSQRNGAMVNWKEVEKDLIFAGVL